ncbi:putative sulfate exporter family transporter [Marinomonas arenicola]|uniref:putative sulfate exporter family transporter n=1 Tax=Marinomonas arenicola TaxID=569601 RepID=UPI00311F9FD9
MKYLSGLVVMLVMSLVSFQIANLNVIKHYQISSLVICILIGMVLGNLFKSVSLKARYLVSNLANKSCLDWALFFMGSL